MHRPGNAVSVGDPSPRRKTKGTRVAARENLHDLFTFRSLLQRGPTSARVALARDIVQTLLREVPVQPSMAAVDYGCGTGLVTLALQLAVQRLLGADTSPGMLAKLQEKTHAMGVTNVQTRALICRPRARRKRPRWI